MDDLISRQAAIDAADRADYTGLAVEDVKKVTDEVVKELKKLPSAQPEVVPHRNYQYLSDYWCECGWHLGKKNDVRYCSNCGRKVKWDG